MASSNPYSPPRATLDVPDGERAPEPATWRLEGRRLIARKGVVLPPVCLYSGETVEGQRVQPDLSWTPVWFKVLVVIVPVIGALSYSYFRRSGTLDHALGPAGRQHRRNAWLLALVVMAVLIAAMSPLIDDLASGFIVVLLSLLVTVLVGTRLARSFKVLSIDRFHIHLGLRRSVAAAFGRVPQGS